MLLLSIYLKPLWSFFLCISVNYIYIIFCSTSFKFFVLGIPIYIFSIVSILNKKFENLRGMFDLVFCF